MSDNPSKRRRVNNKAGSPPKNKTAKKPLMNTHSPNAFTVPGPNKFRPRPVHAPAYFGNENARPRSKRNSFSNLRNAEWKQKGYTLFEGNNINEGDKFLYVEEDGRVFTVEVIRVDVLPDFRNFSAENKKFFIVKSKGDIFTVFNYTRGKHWDFYIKLAGASD